MTGLLTAQYVTEIKDRAEFDVKLLLFYDGENFSAVLEI